MSRHDRFSALYARPSPDLGAREITSFSGSLANDNASTGAIVAGPRRSSSFSLPAFAFLTGLGAATFVTLASHWLGTGG